MNKIQKLAFYTGYLNKEARVGRYTLNPLTWVSPAARREAFFQHEMNPNVISPEQAVQIPDVTKQELETGRADPRLAKGILQSPNYSPVPQSTPTPAKMQPPSLEDDRNRGVAAVNKQTDKRPGMPSVKPAQTAIQPRTTPPGSVPPVSPVTTPAQTTSTVPAKTSAPAKPAPVKPPVKAEQKPEEPAPAAPTVSDYDRRNYGETASTSRISNPFRDQRLARERASKGVSS